MKKTILFLAFICIITGLFAQQRIIVGQNYVNPNEVTLVAERGTSTTLKFDLNELNLTEVVTDYGIMSKMNSAKAPVILIEGVPELIYLPAAIIIPDVGASELDITYGMYTDIENIEIAPSKGNLPRSIDPATVPYVKGEVYERDAFYPGTLATLEEPFIMRDVRGQSLFIFPVQYNPVTKTLRIYSEVTVTVNNTRNTSVNEFTTQKRHSTIDPTFNQMYNNLFINYSSLSRDFPTGEEGELLIICHNNADWINAMKPYVDWKRQIGRKTTLVSTTTTGATVTALKTYIANYYNNPANNLAYVLFVGDIQHIPISNTGDVDYAKITGGDNYLEVLMGRMSVESVADVETQVQRSIWYERDMATSDSWIHGAMGIAKNEGAGNGHDGGESDNVHMNNIRTRLLNYGYNPVHQAYDNIAASAMQTQINNGVSMINFCNHGSETSWSVGGFSNSHVDELQNFGKLPFIFSVACLNGKLDYVNMSANPPITMCFAEAWMRARQNNQPRGAAAVFMAYISISWQPGMTAQDEFVNIVMDIPSPYATSHPTIPLVGTKKTFAGACLNATQKMLMFTYTNGSPIPDFNSWMVFGDPTLMMRTKTPQTMTINHNSVIFFGMSEFAITCDAEGAIATMSTVDAEGDVIILGTTVVADGIANIVLDEPITSPAPLTITVIGRDKVTYVNTAVIATPASGPYVVSGGYTVTGAEKLTYISTDTEIEVTLKNVGVEATGTLTATISCDDSQLTIVNNTATCTGITPDGSAIVKFNVTVAHDIPDNKTFLVDVSVLETGKTEPWDSKLPLKAYAPDFSLEKVLVNDVENGNLEAGTVATITTVVKNKGGAAAYNVKGDLEFNTPFISFACEDMTIPGQQLPANETMELTFTVFTDPDMTYGHVANIGLLLNAQYGREHTAPFTVANTGSSSYCTTTHPSGCNSGDRLTSVIIYKSSDPSNLLINQPNIDCPPGGYGNFTNLTIPLEAGQQYTIKGKAGYANQTVGGWFDLNGNNVFDANERLITMSLAASNTEYTSTFTVPTDFTPGVSRFRLVCKWNSSGTPVPCESSGFGATYDYTIVLPELYPRVENVEAVQTGNSIAVTWDAPVEGTPDGYNIYRGGNKLNETLLTATTFTEENITEGIYAYRVVAVYGTKESFAEMSNVICFFLTCEMPVGLTGTDNEKTAVLTWTKLEGIDELSGYNIFRDGEKLNAQPLTVTEYNDEELANGTYIYQISAVFALSCTESELTEGVEVKIDYVGINELQTDSYSIFPNPTNGNVTIEGKGLSSVEIYDIQGRSLAQYTNVNEKLQINVNSYENGIYFVRITSTSGEMTVKRLVVIK